jgi:hypothetical protein
VSLTFILRIYDQHVNIRSNKAGEILVAIKGDVDVFIILNNFIHEQEMPLHLYRSSIPFNTIL